MTNNNVVLSTPIIIGTGIFECFDITKTEALDWVNSHKPRVFSGHDTVKILGLSPSNARERCTGYDNERVIVPRGRLEFGREYTAEEIEKIGYDLKLIRRV